MKLTYTINPSDTYWYYWYDNKNDYLTSWQASSFVIGKDIDADSKLSISATGLMAGKNNNLTDIVGDYSNAAGIIFAEPNEKGVLDVVELNLPDGTKLGTYASYGAVLLGNPEIGWRPIFSTTSKEGLGTTKIDSVSTELTSLNILFGRQLDDGTKLFITYNDIDDSNPGKYTINFDNASSTYSYTHILLSDRLLHSYVENGVLYINRYEQTFSISTDTLPVTPISLSDYKSIAITFKDSINSTPSTITYNLATNDFGEGSGNDWIAATKNTVTNSTGSTLTGLAGNDFIWGQSGKDYLNGGSGDDILVGGLGDDTLVGGAGNDTYSINNGTGADRIIDESGIDTLSFQTNCNPVFGGELLTYRVGTSMFWRSYTDETNFSTGEIKNFTSSGWIEKIKYTDGYLGNNYTYTNNLIKGNSGTSGNDWICSTPAGGILLGLAGNDVLLGYSGKDTLNGGVGNDFLTGLWGDDSLIGGVGIDTFNITAGTDSVSDLGFGGSDIFVVSSGATANISVAKAWIATNDSINNGTTNITTKGFGINLSAIESGTGFTVTNTGNASTINGSKLADTLIGGAGNDHLTGGAGSDKFVFKLAASSKKVYTLSDFTASDDKIQLSKTVFKGFSAVGSISDTNFLSEAGKNTAATADQKLIYDSSAGKLYYDADGVGGTAAVQIALIGNKAALTSSSFEIIT